MHIFIDANIYLDLFFYPQDDLEELRKLDVLLKEGKATLWLPRQVEDEVLRKRETQIASALKVLREQHLNLKFPRVCHGYAELEGLRRLQRQYALLHEKLTNAVIESARTRTLKADELITSLFGRAEKIVLAETILTAARLRMDRGNPPGKDKKLGDAINWECLLSAVPCEDLHLVSRDQDFASAIDRNKPNPFLEYEWGVAKPFCALRYYGHLTAFLREFFPNVNLAEDLEKVILIERLAASYSFAETHSLIARLSWWNGRFSLAELISLLQIVAHNNQVYWIIGDPDVHSFVSRLLSDAQGKAPNEIVSAVIAILPQPEQAHDSAVGVSSDA